MMILDTTCHTTIATLIFSLLASAKVAEQFDERPSLKFLLQKLCHLPEVTNLYKVHASCTGLHLWTLFQMWLRMGDDEGSLKAAIDAAFADIFAGLEKAECNAAKHKLAAFAREKVCEVTLLANTLCVSKVFSFPILLKVKKNKS